MKQLRRWLIAVVSLRLAAAGQTAPISFWSIPELFTTRVELRPSYGSAQLAGLPGARSIWNRVSPSNWNRARHWVNYLHTWPAGASPKRKIPGGSGDRVTQFLQQ